MAKTQFDDDWKNWIRTNVDDGQDKNGLFKILLDEDYDYDLIKRALEFEPTIPIDQLVNPLKAPRSRGLQAANDAAPAARPSPQTGLYLPNSARIDTDRAEIHVVRDFLDEKECRGIISRIESNLRPSEISRQDEPDALFRTSRTCDLRLLRDPFVDEIDERICRFIGLDASCSEGIQGQFYEVGQEFKAHTDYFEADELPKFAGDLGQRSYTFMIYLNDVEAGGETEFVNLGLSFAPERGTAVIWNSLHDDGTPNPATMHHGRPVLSGHKAIITKWFRVGKNGPIHIKEQNEYIRNYTRVGFQKAFLPPGLFDEIVEFYNSNYSVATQEHVPGGFVRNKDSGGAGSVMIELSAQMKNKIHATLKPVLESWSNVELKPTYVYGIRVYQNGAILEPHRDRQKTHILSAIINVDQNTNENWPLLIEDNYYRSHNVVMRPGEIVLYEGARLIHGRPTPLDGELYANIFCHFMPEEFE